MHRIDFQRIEQFEVVHDVILNIRERRIVTGFAKTWVIWNDDAKLFSPMFCKFETIHSAGAMKQHERFTLSCGVDNGLHAIDGQLFAYELAHCTPPDFRNRGITSSANSVMFLTAFQCGMSATCITLLM